MRYKRVVVARAGGPEALQVVEDDLPEPGPGQVRPRVLAAGVAWGDLLQRVGIGKIVLVNDMVGAGEPDGPGHDGQE